MSRAFLYFAYGVFAYVLFVGVYVAAVAFVGGFILPVTLDGPARAGIGVSLAIDAALLLAFAVQHSGMARQGFKRWWTRIIPPPIERSTYVLVSNLLMIVLFAAWHPIDVVVWNVESPLARGVLWTLFGAGWAIILLSSFLIDHFELFGLAQVWRHVNGDTPAQPAFRAPGLYRIVRHPLYVGWILAFWATPRMTVGHLVFAVGTLGYILVAIRLEERDLLAAHGEEYAKWRERTPMLLPKIGRN